jgi:hypothetical protein
MDTWAATQVNGLSPEIHVVSEVDVVHLTEGSTLTFVSQNLRSWNIAGISGTWRDDESPTGSETVAPAKHFDQNFLIQKSRVRENLKSCSMRGPIVASRENNPKR